MSIESTSTTFRLEEFESHLKTARYAVVIQRRYLWIAQRFVDYLGKKCIAVEAAHAPECDDFLAGAPSGTLAARKHVVVFLLAHPDETTGGISNTVSSGPLAW
jgi:hypothetical protein